MAKVDPAEVTRRLAAQKAASERTAQAAQAAQAQAARQAKARSKIDTSVKRKGGSG